jgi:hypothetical protein
MKINEIEQTLIAERMPASVIKSKQMYANMSDEELAHRFKGKDEQTLRQMAWRHGYGKMSSHYLDRVNTVKEGKPTDMDCWDGYKKDGTKPGTGKNKGKRVNNCVPK